jgi:hypothetical protein
METMKDLQVLPENQKNVENSQYSEPIDVTEEISKNFGDKANLVIVSESTDAPIIIKIKSEIPTYEDWIKGKYYDWRCSAKFTQMIGMNLIKTAKQFGINLKLNDRVNKTEYIKLGKLIYGDEEAGEDALRNKMMSKIKSKIQTYEDWIKEEFYTSGKTNNFTEFFNVSLIEIAKQFGIELKNNYRLLKSEYFELGKLIYEYKDPDQEVLIQNMTTRIQSKIPTAETWIKRRYFAPDYRNNFTKLIGTNLVEIAKQSGIHLKPNGRVGKTEYIELGKLIYGEEKIELAIKKIREEAKEKKQKAKENIQIKKKKVKKKSRIRRKKINITKKPEPSEKEIQTTIEETIQEVSEAANTKVDQTITKEIIISKIKSEVPTYLEWIYKRFYEKWHNEEFEKIAGKSLYRVTRQFGIHKGGHGVSLQEYAELGSLIYDPDPVMLMRGLMILTR